MALHHSFFDLSDDEGDRRLSEDDEPQAIEEIVEGEVEAFNDEAGDGDNDIDDLFGESGGTASDAAKKEVKEKKVRKSVGPKMNTERLKGPGGIILVDELFKDFKMRGRGHELDDIEEILKRMQSWAHRMYPKFSFPDCIDQIERLGTKMDLKNFMLRNRNVAIQPDVTPIRLLDDDDDDAANVDDPAAAFTELVAADSPPSSPAAPQPPPPTDEQLERARLNREAALRRRAEKIRELEMLALNGSGSDVAVNGSLAHSSPRRDRASQGDDDSTVVSTSNHTSAPSTPIRNCPPVEGDNNIEVLAGDSISVPTTPNSSAVTVNGTSMLSTPIQPRSPSQYVGTAEDAIEDSSVSPTPKRRRISSGGGCSGPDIVDGTTVPSNPSRTLLHADVAGLSPSKDSLTTSDASMNHTNLAAAESTSRSGSRQDNDVDESAVSCLPPSVRDGGSVPVSQVPLLSDESYPTSQAAGGTEEIQPAFPAESMDI